MEQKVPIPSFFRGYWVEKQIIGNFDEIIVGCRMIFDEKMKFHSI